MRRLLVVLALLTVTTSFAASKDELVKQIQENWKTLEALALQNQELREAAKLTGTPSEREQLLLDMFEHERRWSKLTADAQKLEAGKASLSVAEFQKERDRLNTQHGQLISAAEEISARSIRLFTNYALTMERTTVVVDSLGEFDRLSVKQGRILIEYSKLNATDGTRSQAEEIAHKNSDVAKIYTPLVGNYLGSLSTQDGQFYQVRITLEPSFIGVQLTSDISNSKIPTLVGRLQICASGNACFGKDNSVDEITVVEFISFKYEPNTHELSLGGDIRNSGDAPVVRIEIQGIIQNDRITGKVTSAFKGSLGSIDLVKTK